MKLNKTMALVTVILSTVMSSAWANELKDGMSMIDIAGHEVPVEAGGLYDRYRSNPPLEVIESESPNTDLSWFESLKKQKVDIGFESYSPNFYYENTKVTAVFTADLEALTALMPAEVLEQVQPIQIWPGRGLVALTAYAYHYCDNDSYNEVALSIITNKPGESNWGPFTLVGQSMAKDFWGYVLKLPVDTELARVRGVVGYNLPKWLTDIHYSETEQDLTFELVDAETGKVDVTLTTKKLADVSHEPILINNSFTNLDQQGELTYGYAVSRQLGYGSSSDAEDVTLTLSEGSLSRYMKALDLGSLVKYEYVPSFQSALYAPKPLSALTTMQ
ncbi:MAG: acetoacetate decarboxylase (ADC) [Gammaproteobacteria bacterium]|nr:acetoacetate decarboxylase (ADC) [Gammaproteobacteria bacterium]